MTRQAGSEGSRERGAATWRVEAGERGASLSCAEVALAELSLAHGEGDPVPLPLGGAPPCRVSLGLLDLELTLQAEGGCCRLAGRVHNRGAVPLVLGELRLRAGRASLGRGARLRAFCNGHQSWTESRSFGPAERMRVPLLPFARVMQDNLHNLGSGQPGDLRSELYCLLGAPALGRHLLCAQGPGFAQFVYQRLTFASAQDDAPRLELTWDFGGARLAPGQGRALDGLSLRFGSDPLDLLESWLAEVAQPAAASAALPVGWCTWYDYGTRVREEDLHENLAELARRRPDWQLFQLDDGYQTQVGDWRSLNAKFPAGLGDLVRRCEDAGLAAGLWLAPFTVHSRSQLAQAHPEWLLRRPDGRPASAGYNPMWGLRGGLHGLDCSHPGAQAYLRELVGHLVHELGFRYLKLDFLYSASLYAEAHDPDLGPAERLALGLDQIRSAAGPEVFLLGCGAPLGPCIGRVDGMRVGPDVAPFWFPTLRHGLTRDRHALSALFSIRSTLTRSLLHRRLWLNDPDCLLLRQERNRLSAVERATLACAVAISGGMFLVSDRLADLDESAWPHLARIQAVTRACAGGRCLPLDLLERPIPELVLNTAGYLALFNFSGRAQQKTVAGAVLAPYLPPQAVLRPWNGGPPLAREADGSLGPLPLPAHGSLLLRWTP